MDWTRPFAQQDAASGLGRRLPTGLLSLRWPHRPGSQQAGDFLVGLGPAAVSQPIRLNW